MAKALKINYVTTHDDGGDGAFMVLAKSGAAWFHHNGPVGFSHFTKEQADRLARKVLAAGQINLAHWAGSSCSEGEIEERWAVDAFERR